MRTKFATKGLALVLVLALGTPRFEGRIGLPATKQTDFQDNDNAGLRLVAREDQTGVLATKAEAVGEHRPHFFGPGLIGNVIQVAGGIGCL